MFPQLVTKAKVQSVDPSERPVLPKILLPQMWLKDNQLKILREEEKSLYGSTGLNEVDVNSGDSQMMDVDDTISAQVNEGTTQVDEGTTEVNEGTTKVNEGTAKVNESTTGANLSTEPSMKEVEVKAGPANLSR
ncbi:hypothetical protein Tco_0379354 [Tanacetum coccineum]